MISIGFESTAHTLGIGVCEEGKMLANELAMYTAPQGEGLHPRKLAEHHEKVFGETYNGALERANVKPEEIDVVSFARGPGLGPCLKVGLIAAKKFSLKYKKPIIGVNHCVAHIEIGKLLSNFADPLVIYVSGGNTQIIAGEIIKIKGKKKTKYRVIGETLDLGLGNMIDNFARIVGEKSHGGIVEKLAEKGKYVQLPYIVKGMSFSFSGILTDLERKFKTGRYSKEDLAYSLQETSFAMIAEASERALCLTKKKEILGVGGVMQNKRITQMLAEMGEPHGAVYKTPPSEFNRDNGGMIAYTGLLMYQKGWRDEIEKLNSKQRWRTDDIIF